MPPATDATLSTLLPFLSFPKGICFSRLRVPRISLLKCGFPHRLSRHILLRLSQVSDCHPERRDSRFLVSSGVEGPAFLRATAFALALFAALSGLLPAAKAQTAPCFEYGRRTNFQPPRYPPIARAAHVSGVVVTLVTFAQDGSVAGVNVLSGPESLRSEALRYVHTLRAKPSSGSRECPYSVSFHVASEHESCEQKSASEVITSGIQVCLESIVLDTSARSFTTS